MGLDQEDEIKNMVCFPFSSDEDPLYTGRLSLSFSYKAGNTAGYNADSINNNVGGNGIKSDLLEATSKLVNRIAEEELYQRRVVATTEQRTGGAIRRDRRSLRSASAGDDNETAAKTIVPIGGCLLQVEFDPDSLVIYFVKDVDCSDPDVGADMQCQKVDCNAVLTLTDEPKYQTELLLRTRIGLEIAAENLLLPVDSAVDFVGASAAPKPIPVLENKEDEYKNGVPVYNNGVPVAVWLGPILAVFAVLASIVFLILWRNKKKGDPKDDVLALPELQLADDARKSRSSSLSEGSNDSLSEWSNGTSSEGSSGSSSGGGSSSQSEMSSEQFHHHSLPPNLADRPPESPLRAACFSWLRIIAEESDGDLSSIGSLRSSAQASQRIFHKSASEALTKKGVDPAGDEIIQYHGYEEGHVGTNGSRQVDGDFVFASATTAPTENNSVSKATVKYNAATSTGENTAATGTIIKRLEIPKTVPILVSRGGWVFFF